MPGTAYGQMLGQSVFQAAMLLSLLIGAQMVSLNLTVRLSINRHNQHALLPAQLPAGWMLAQSPGMLLSFLLALPLGMLQYHQALPPGMLPLRSASAAQPLLPAQLPAAWMLSLPPGMLPLRPASAACMLFTRRHIRLCATHRLP